jgi:polysaccharide biosynthesis transport protein
MREDNGGVLMLQQDELRSHGYFDVLKRRKWVILQALVLVPLVAVLLSIGQGRLYQATAQVLLTYQNLAAGVAGTAASVGVLQQPDRLAETQVVLARAPAIFDRVAATAGVPGRSAQEIQNSSSVSVEANADILDFHVTDPSRAAAIRLAKAYARQYTIYKQSIDSASIVHARAKVKRRIGQLRRSGQAGTPLYSNLVKKDQQLSELESLETSNAFIIRSPSSAVQVRPRPLRNGLLGVLAGLFLGLVLAFIWERLDRRVRSAEELEETLGLPLMARLPEPRRQIVAKKALAALEEPNSFLTESFRVLWTSIELANLDVQARSLLFTSAMHGEGKSPVSSNLAVTIARTGKRVVLVDLDLRKPSVAALFDVDGAVPGLTEVALGHATLDDALLRVAVTDSPGTPKTPYASNGKGANTVEGVLELLHTGPLPPDPGDFVGSSTLVNILRELNQRADFVIIDAPPIVGRIHDAMVLSTHVDAVVAVARLGVVTRPMAQEFQRVLDMAPAPKLGLVVIGAEITGETQAYEAYYGAPATKTHRPRVLRDLV